MPSTRSQSFLTLAIGVALAAVISWACIQHDMPAIAVAAIALSVAYTSKDGADRIANTIRAARQTRAAR